MKNKVNVPKWLYWVIGISVLLIIISPFIPQESQENKSNTEQPNNTPSYENNSGYKTSIEWTNNGQDEVESWLKVAVENDNYDGDILESGTYTVTQTNGEYKGTAQRVYNIYISTSDTEEPEVVKNESLPYTVGGVNGSQIEINVEKGQYLYIQKVFGSGDGHLKIMKNN